MIAGYSVLLYAGVVLPIFFVIARCIVKSEQKKMKQEQAGSFHERSQSVQIEMR